jgi:rhamnogalacturonyl hydrolase YesR
MSRSIISRSQGLFTSSNDSSGPLQAGFLQKTFNRVIGLYPNHTSTPVIQSYMSQSADSLLGIFSNTSSALTYPLDRLSSGNEFINQYEKTGDEKYKTAFQSLKQSIDKQPRNTEGGLWYYVYPNWSYLDGMYSFGPFWTLYTLLYTPNKLTAWTELTRQFRLVADHCECLTCVQDMGRGGVDGLLVHGYDDSKTAVWANNSKGASGHVWGRSLGWYVMGLLETLVILDTQSSRVEVVEQTYTEGVQHVQVIRGVFLDEFRRRMEAVARAVDPHTGGWWQVVDSPGREKNYIESSGSAMFAYALLEGVRRGYLEPKSELLNSSYVDIGRRGYEYIKNTFVVENGNGTLGWNGTVGVCSLNSTASYEYYVGRPLVYNSVLGSAAFILASLEVERLDA